MDAEKSEIQRLDFNCACAFITGEPYILKQAFKDFNPKNNHNSKNNYENFNLNEKIFSPSLNFFNGLESEEKSFVNIAKTLGIKDEENIKSVYKNAVKMQLEFQEELYQTGTNFLNELKNNPETFAIVLLGRSYNSFADFANKGIPRKFASRGITVIPLDMIDIRDKKHLPRMYWESGNRILKVAEIVKNNPQLFATYITNFSCVPDSMLLNTFRKTMEAKPSLTLELDSHSADAGINTRIDAFIDIVQNYLRISNFSCDGNSVGFLR